MDANKGLSAGGQQIDPTKHVVRKRFRINGMGGCAICKGIENVAAYTFMHLLNATVDFTSDRSGVTMTTDTVIDPNTSGTEGLSIQELPELQRRRFVLHHEFGLTYEQIAEMEGRRKSAVCESVLRAEEKIREKIKNLKD